MTRRRTVPAHGERGVALIIVLLVVTLLTILVIEFTYTVQVESHISRNSLNSLQATYLARSGINLLAGALVMDEDIPANVDPAGGDNPDGWRSFVNQGCIRVLKNEEWMPPTWDLCVRIVDESGKINVNFTRPANQRQNPNVPQECVPNNQATLHYCWLDALERLGASFGLPENGLQELAEYWTAGAPQQVVGQAAGQLAPEFGALEDVAAAFPALQNRSVYDSLRRYVTALPATNQQRQVNINTAPLAVLTAILDDEAIAQDIVTKRQEQPFANASEALSGLDNQNLVARRMFTVRSVVFRLEAVATVNGVGKTIRAMVQRERSGKQGGQGSQGGIAGAPVTWRLTYLDWQKESGTKAAREATEDADSGEGEGLEGDPNSANGGD